MIYEQCNIFISRFTHSKCKKKKALKNVSMKSTALNYVNIQSIFDFKWIPICS